MEKASGRAKTATNGWTGLLDASKKANAEKQAAAEAERREAERRAERRMAAEEKAALETRWQEEAAALRMEVSELQTACSEDATAVDTLRLQNTELLSCGPRTKEIESYMESLRKCQEDVMEEAQALAMQERNRNEEARALLSAALEGFVLERRLLDEAQIAEDWVILERLGRCGVDPESLMALQSGAAPRAEVGTWPDMSSSGFAGLRTSTSTSLAPGSDTRLQTPGPRQASSVRTDVPRPREREKCLHPDDRLRVARYVSARVVGLLGESEGTRDFHAAQAPAAQARPNGETRLGQPSGEDALRAAKYVSVRVVDIAVSLMGGLQASPSSNGVGCSLEMLSSTDGLPVRACMTDCG
eukprot:CAMPEP_0117552122 /NCGR_PEP_ID=MMETSP0784-20121206/49545_1 /TAXON_ID=39447 /ORGANISM="" /LENGTH=357 /DNA_ID=CAMNT_0005349185 /DNA_START=159 /DNA_END=1232 /DNA_ORIENTATION=-